MDDPSGRNVHQWMNVDFCAKPDGTVSANITLENQCLLWVQGQRLIAKDARGNLLLEVISPELAIAGKRDPKTPNRATVAWSFQASPQRGTGSTHSAPRCRRSRDS